MSMYTIERRQTTLGALANQQLINFQNNAAMRTALNQALVQQVAQAQAQTSSNVTGDPYATAQVDYLPLVVATAAGFALGAAGIVMLLKRRGAK